MKNREPIYKKIYTNNELNIDIWTTTFRNQVVWFKTRKDLRVGRRWASKESIEMLNGHIFENETSFNNWLNMIKLKSS